MFGITSAKNVVNCVRALKFRTAPGRVPWVEYPSATGGHFEMLIGPICSITIRI